MSILKYFRKSTSDTQELEGSFHVLVDSFRGRFPLVRYRPQTTGSNDVLSRWPDAGKSSQGAYQKLSAEKKAEVGKRAAECGVAATLRFMRRSSQKSSAGS